MSFFEFIDILGVFFPLLVCTILTIYNTKTQSDQGEWYQLSVTLGIKYLIFPHIGISQELMRKLICFPMVKPRSTAFEFLYTMEIFNFTYH